MSTIRTGVVAFAAAALGAGFVSMMGTSQPAPEGAEWLQRDGNLYATTNVGIGTSAPTRALHVVSPDSQAAYALASAPGGITYGLLGQAKSTSGRGVAGWASAPTGGGIGIFGQANSPNGYGGYFIGRGFFSGNVGIGLANPTQRLDVAGGIAVNGVPVISGAGKWVGQAGVGPQGPAGPMGPQGPVGPAGGGIRGVQGFWTGGSFQVPPGVTTLLVEAWGAGAGGSQSYYGGSGAYAMDVVSVTPGQSLLVFPGIGGAPGQSGFGTRIGDQYPYLISAPNGKPPSVNAHGDGGRFSPPTPSTGIHLDGKQYAGEDYDDFHAPAAHRCPHDQHIGRGGRPGQQGNNGYILIVW